MYAAHMTISEELAKLRQQCRNLRQTNACITRAWQIQKQRRTALEEENEILRKRIEKVEKEKQQLEDELEKIKRQRDTYKGMVFKPNVSTSQSPKEHKPLGGQIGHVGKSRKLPAVIDQEIHTYLSSCPNCDTRLTRVSSVVSHTVVDIPQLVQNKPQATRYSVERQWCPKCQKEVHATPRGVIPGSRLGINLVTLVMIWHYRFREVFAKIVERLATEYDLTASEGEIVAILMRCRLWLGPKYDKLVIQIRAAPHKHADETGWRINGVNCWAWTFVSDKSVVYTIEESRGKGVAAKYLDGASGVLVRDDYGAYTKLLMNQQSCWTHLLRKSHDAKEAEGASEEVEGLHSKLKALFTLLLEDLAQPFDERQRQILHAWYTQDLEKIINAVYTQKDAQAIQTRVKNQNKNLLTALLFDGVPLTNNAAERAIRPLVVTRKISGGSKTPQGAETHAVNMSIIETINKQQLPLLATLKSYLLSGAFVKR